MLMGKDIMTKNDKNFYGDTRSKVIDFFIGFVGGFVLSGIGTLFIGLMDSFGNLPYEILDMIVYITYATILVLFIVSIVYCFKIQRKWVGIGIIGVVVLPIIVFLLFFGACLIILGTGNMY